MEVFFSDTFINDAKNITNTIGTYINDQHSVIIERSLTKEENFFLMDGTLKIIRKGLRIFGGLEKEQKFVRMSRIEDKS